MKYSENGKYRKYGQVFLKDRNMAMYEASLFDTSEGREILEIGPGEGSLTKFLLQSGAHVTAVESDHRFVQYLEENFRDEVALGQLHLIKGDILKMDPMDVDAIFGNIPYSISSPILFSLGRFKFRKCILMVQAEFAKRMVAGKGTSDYSRLSVSTQLRYEARIERRVPRNCFSPVPEVDSAIVTLSPLNLHDESELKAVEEVVKMLFSHRRKKIGTIYKKAPQEIYEKRVEDLSPEEIFSFAASVVMP